MKVIYGLNNLKCQRKKSVATIGIFDGVHIGHQKILTEVVRQAKTRRQIATVLTFYPHPQKVLGSISSKSTITSLEHRLKLLQDIGVDLCIVIRFTRALSKRPIDWLIRHVLVKKLKATTLIIGSRFKLGRERVSAKDFKKLLHNHGLGLKIIPTQRYEGKVISSSLIRNLIKTGRLDIGSKLLGRSVAIYGTVKPGRRIGRTIGFKTANIDPHHEAMPPTGVYAVKVKVYERYYRGVLNIGFRPTLGLRQKEPEIEVHILGFDGSLYNKPIELFFVKKIRSEKHFKNKAALREQIKKDILYNI